VKSTTSVFVPRNLSDSVIEGLHETRDGMALATPEKAIFDFVYVTQASGHNHERLPELDLPARFSRRSLDRWVKRISSPRL
jgi:hypothetical protein